MIAAKVANALALDYPRDRLEVIVACDGSHRRDGASAPREAGADLVLDLPRGGKIRAQDAAVERRARRDRRVLRRQRAAGARRAARARRAVRRPAGRLRLRPGRVRQRRRARTRRACTGATRWRCARSSRGCARSPAATARSTRRAATPTSSSTRSWATTSASRSRSSSAAGARSTGRRARATEKMVPTIEGEFARKRRMMSHAWPIVVRGGLADPRGYPPRYALMIASHRAAALRRAVPAPRSRSALAARPGCRRSRCSPPPRSARRSRPRRCSSRATTCSPRRRSRAGLYDWLRHGTEAGWDAAGGHAVMPPRVRHRRRRGGARCSRSPILALAIVAIRLESPGHPIYRQRRIGKDGEPFDVLKLRTMVAGAESMGSGLAVNEGDPRITRVGALLRRFSIDELPEPRQRPARATWRSSARARRSRCRSSSTPTASAGGSRSSPASPAGRRSTAARRCRGASASSSTSGTSSTARCGSTSQILLRTAAIVFGGEGLYKGDDRRLGRRAAGPAAADATDFDGAPTPPDLAPAVAR